ncbi:MAG: trypsin-like serine protease [Acidimicrobiales bacterium]
MRRRLAPLALAAALLLPVAVATPASAGDGATAPSDPGATTNIVGGSFATDGQFPWTAFLVRKGESRSLGFSCGASVLSRSWVLTAGHCVLDYEDLYPGSYVGPGYFDVVTGSRTLSGSSGQRLAVAAVYPHPSYDPETNDDDVALLRLATPTSAPEIAVIGSSSAEQALDDAGTTATVIGWGTTSSGGSISDAQRYVQVPVQSNATCNGAYPPGFTDPDGYLLEYHGSNMICAGPMDGGKDSCQGDSGGPLAVQAPDTSWRLIGAVSFGYLCAEPNFPGIYHRLTSSASWVSRTRRFGPFNADGTSYIRQQYADFAGRAPTSSELSSWKGTLASSPASNLPIALQASAAWDGNAGMNTRLYRAAFLRTPDTNGLSFWIHQRWAGRGPVSIANSFVASSEFQNRYGALDDGAFVDLVYQNVFGRAADPSGRAYWVGKLAKGTGRGQVLYELSNSKEYRTKNGDLVRIITTRFGLLRAVPTSGEYATSAGMSQRELVDALRTSYRYAQRFGG